MRTGRTAFLVLMMAPSLFGQSGRLTDSDIFGDAEKAASRGALSIVQPKGLALESTIDPASYFVGPSDVFSVNIWISPPASFLLTVTPEGTLIVPTVGEVHVADMTLAEAKKKVVGEIRKKYIFGNVSVTLTTPRSIVVMVTGNVLNPGSYVLASYGRVDKAVEEANKPQRTQSYGEAQYLVSTMSTRNIRVKHKDGSITHVDIPKFRATKEDRWNPYLREGDVIVAPRSNPLKNVIGVYGEVNVPGRHEYVEGDSIKDAIQIAYGFTSYALTDSVELSRLNADGSTMTSLFFDGPGLLAGRFPDVALRPGDRIVIRAKPDSRADYRVTVEGEVVYPGVYPITKNSTRLSEIIRKAGGFTQFASIRNSQLSRRSVNPNEVELERLESLHGGVPSEDTSYYYLETNLRLRKEVVSVDFEHLFVEGDSTHDVILKDGDLVSIASQKKTVYVFGQVVSPGHTPFVPNETVQYYINQGGGFTERAREGDVKVVKATTKQWLSPKETHIEEGDYIWVPKEIERPFSYYMSIIGQTASIVSVAVSLILLTR